MGSGLTQGHPVFCQHPGSQQGKEPSQLLTHPVYSSISVFWVISKGCTRARFLRYSNRPRHLKSLLLGPTYEIPESLLRSWTPAGKLHKEAVETLDGGSWLEEAGSCGHILEGCVVPGSPLSPSASWPPPWLSPVLTVLDRNL